MNLHYAEEAIQDLERLRTFIEAKNPLTAQRISIELLTGIEKLKTFPNIGLPVKRAPDPEKIRDLYIGDYTVRYLVGQEDIFILRLWHGKENEKTYNQAGH